MGFVYRSKKIKNHSEIASTQKFTFQTSFFCMHTQIVLEIIDVIVNIFHVILFKFHTHSIFFHRRGNRHKLFFCADQSKINRQTDMNKHTQ